MDSWTAWYERRDPKNSHWVCNSGTVFVSAETYREALTKAQKAASALLGGVSGVHITYVENQAYPSSK